ncbi:MAG: PAS domain-containing protein [Spirochaetales bacterium]|nr:PAS domain-containing protein [Spirochaetales bacterium]
MNNTMSTKILEQLPTPVMAINKEMELIFLNDAGCDFVGKNWEELKGCKCYDVFNTEHCETANCRMKQVMDGKDPTTIRTMARVGENSVPIEYTADKLVDEKGAVIGGLEYIIDITETVKKEQKLKEQSRTIMEISTPVLKLWDRILILPIVGIVDSYRAQQMMDVMLNKLKETASKLIILDIQGVAAVDTAVANHLIKIAKATRLMGCTCIISGISPAVAQTLVQLGIDLGSIKTNSTLQEALSSGFEMLNIEVSK